MQLHSITIIDDFRLQTISQNSSILYFRGAYVAIKFLPPEENYEASEYVIKHHLKIQVKKRFFARDYFLRFPKFCI